MKSTPARTALITGASTGIGFELSHIFAQEGYNLIIVARNEIRLKNLAKEIEKKYGNKVAVMAQDLSKANSPEELYQKVKKAKLNVDILVNNAGFATYGKFASTDLNVELEMIQVNITTLTHLSKLFLRDMVKQNSGKILNVASTAAFQPGPLMAVYFATKAYVLSFSQALQNELTGTAISVSALCPGPTATQFSERAKMGKSKLFQNQIMDAKTVAQQGFEGLMKNKAIIIPGFKNRLLVFSERFTPRSLVIKLVRKIQEEEKSAD